jgi:hypothetical protein
MRERAEPFLKIACLILAAFVLYRVAGIFLRINPLHGVVVPALPALAASTNNPPGGVRGTNPVVSISAIVKGTNIQHSAETNIAASAKITGTNLISPPVPIAAGTNPVVEAPLVKMETNVASHPQMKIGETNVASATTNAQIGTNILVAPAMVGTNISRPPRPAMTAANFIPPPGMAGMGMAVMGLNPFAPPGRRVDDLPPAIQARVSRIVDSEILGPVMHPLPMALLGIAGDVAFLRTATGQTGLVKEGDALGEIKLVKIGINRVLIEQDGQRKELMIFSGYGGESLLPKQTGTPDENNHP